MPSFAVGDNILVPAAQLPNPDRQPFALVQKVVLGQNQRSVRVNDGQGGTVDVASRLVHGSGLGFLVLRIGDLNTETALLDPLAKSVLQFLRLLIPDGDLRSLTLRTTTELEAHWASNHGGTSHVVLIGHGSATSLSFVGDGAVPEKSLQPALKPPAPRLRPRTSCLSRV